jgi:hypothetical protein
MCRIIGLIVLVLFPVGTLTAIAQSDIKGRADVMGIDQIADLLIKVEEEPK